MDQLWRSDWAQGVEEAHNQWIVYFRFYEKILTISHGFEREGKNARKVASWSVLTVSVVLATSNVRVEEVMKVLQKFVISCKP